MDVTHNVTEQEALGHILPGWFQRFQEITFLPLMIIAEMLINGFMMASGLVGDINNPFAGGWSHWLSEVTWVALFLAGAVMGGMAIRTSAAASYWFSRNIGRALFNLLGMFGFVALEVWASVMQRSYNPITSPADQAVLAWAGFTHPSVTITDVVVAVALPLAAMFWGFSTMRPAQKTAAEVRAEGERRIAQAEINAQVRTAQMRGLVQTAAATGVGELAKRLVGESTAERPADDSAQASDSSSDRGPDDDGSDPGSSSHRGVVPQWSVEDLAGELASSAPITLAQKRAMLNNLPAVKRVGQTGVIGVNDLTELLGCSASQAGTILRNSGLAQRLGESRTSPSVASAPQLTAWLVRHDSPAYREHGRKLETALKLGRRRRTVDALPSGSVSDFTPDRDTAPQLAVVGSPAQRAGAPHSTGEAADSETKISYLADHHVDRGAR